MKLSVIIPLYNAESYIGKCLDSVLDCDLDKSEYEVIVVDDGSVDDGLAIVREYAERYSNIRIFHQENQGQSVARNWGIKEAKGDYIWFVDSDDYVDATHISSILDMMREKNIEICKFEMKVFREDGTCQLEQTKNVEYDIIYSGEDVFMSDIPVGSVCNGIFQTKFILDNNLTFYPGIIRQDSEFSIRSTALAKRIIYLNQHCYVYRYNENSCTRSKSYEKKLKAHVCDAIVARNIHRFVGETTDLSAESKNCLDDFATSIVKGRLISYIVTKDSDSIKLFSVFVEKATMLGEYPLRVTNSQLKDRAVAIILNNNRMMRFFVKLRNICGRVVL